MYILIRRVIIKRNSYSLSRRDGIIVTYNGYPIIKWEEKKTKKTYYNTCVTIQKFIISTQTHHTVHTSYNVYM